MTKQRRPANFPFNSASLPWFSRPARVIDQSREFIEKNDPVADCLREAFALHPSLESPAAKAYETYMRWHAQSGREDEALSMNKFASSLEKKGVRKVRRSSGNIYIGIRPAADILAEADDGDE